MTIWFHDPETGTLRYSNMDDEAPLAAALRDWSRPVSPRLWLGMILLTLNELGVAVPHVPQRNAAAALVFWNHEGDASFFPLFGGELKPSDMTRLGFILHEVAQFLIEHPDAWERVPWAGDEDEGADS